MGKTATGSEPRELIPAKKYGAVICGVYELGTQRGNYGPQNQWLVMFSLHGRKKGQPIRDKKGEVLTISEFVNFYLGTPAKPSPLLKLIQAAENRTFTADEIKKGYDLERLIDKACELNVVHKANTSGVMQARIDGISPLDPEDDATPEPALSSFYWDIPASGWDGSIPDGADQVPKFVRTFIEKSDEYKAAKVGGNGNGKRQESAATATVGGGEDDDEGEKGDDPDTPF